MPYEVTLRDTKDNSVVIKITREDPDAAVTALRRYVNIKFGLITIRIGDGR